MTANDRPLEHFDTSKTRALLAYLAAESAVPQQRDFLAALLWPGFSNEAALRNLRLTLFRLRRLLGQSNEGRADQPSGDILLFPDRQSIQLNTGAVATDLQEFLHLLDEAARHTHTGLFECPDCLENLSRAVVLYRGDFLDGLSIKDSTEFDEWLMLRRERYQQMALEALDRIVNHYLLEAENHRDYPSRQQAFEEARRFTQRLLEIEPWRESAHRQLMKVLAMGGQVQEALAQYEICRQMLEESFDIEPDPLTTSLYQQIRERTFHPQAARRQDEHRPPSNLLSQLTPLIGREAQLARLERLLFAYRWVTLVGEGGVGKTRLALTTAEKVLPQFPDGVWVVPLVDYAASAVFRPGPPEVRDVLAKAIADVLHLKLHEQASLLQQLFEFLRPKKLLLILDSFEQLSPGADLIVELLKHAPGIHILVTTRQVLHYQAGYIMRVDGLPVPETDDDPQGDQYASVQLFTERAERLSGSFRLDAHTLPWVIRICRLLDGVPLAVELAAPWTLRRSLEEIVYEIQNDLDFLSTTMAGTPERHRSMRAVIESSWQRISPRERETLVHCARFARDFTFDQLQALITVTQAELDDLVDKFLVFQISPRRYRLHEVLRQFALQQQQPHMEVALPV